MRSEHKPHWLTEIQNKSWEPEILISGITLTFIFLLPNQIRNLFAKLIQEYDVHFLISFVLYIIITIMLTGVKFILIAHLILRGFWTGLVGISYVYPKGIRRSRMGETDSKKKFPKPLDLVIQVEKICSILFAFVFTSFSFFISTIILYIPIILLRFVLVNKSVYFYGIIFYTLILVPLIVFIINAKYKNTVIGHNIQRNIFTNIMFIFTTNIGTRKMPIIFGVYFILIVSLCAGQVLDFAYFNRKTDRSPAEGIPHVDYREYESDRIGVLRIPKATIQSFEIHDGYLTLFVAYYKEDIHTLKRAAEHAEEIREFYPYLTTTDIDMVGLIRVRIDSTRITDIPWYKVRKAKTGQLGFKGTIPIDSLSEGYHELTIDKLLWRRNKNRIRLIESWSNIPFVKAG